MHAYGIIGQHEALIADHQSVGWDFYGSMGYRRWAGSLGRLQAACGDEQLLHLHHGALADRQYRSRIDGLAHYGIDVESDVLTYPRNRNEDAVTELYQAGVSA